MITLTWLSDVHDCMCTVGVSKYAHIHTVLSNEAVCADCVCPLLSCAYVECVICLCVHMHLCLSSYVYINVLVDLRIKTILLLVATGPAHGVD